MILQALVMIPAAAAVGAFTDRSERRRVIWLVVTAVVHTVLVGWAWIDTPAPALDGWLALDDLSLLVLSVVSVLFTVVATYVVGSPPTPDARGGRAFVSYLLAFLAAASLVAISQHLGLFWVGIEGTTFALAPLIYHRQDRASLEATWTYLLVSSVAIALALLGTFLLATAQGPGRTLVLADLLQTGRDLQRDLLRASFVFLLVGYGTKMGIAPLHAWKPATYGEAPPLVGALLAGGLTSCAFLGIARITQISIAAGLEDVVRPLLIGFGVLSLLTAAGFMLRQRDLKRLLAYSSVEHMGLALLGLGIGGAAAYGTALHVVGNGLAKGVAFLALGNVVIVTGSSRVERWGGVLRRVPRSGILLLLAFLALLGVPPSSLFISELTILWSAVVEGHVVAAAGAALGLAIVFAAAGGIVLEALLGRHEKPTSEAATERGWLYVGAAVIMLGVIGFGLYLPIPLHATLSGAAAALGGMAP